MNRHIWLGATAVSVVMFHSDAQNVSVSVRGSLNAQGAEQDVRGRQAGKSV